LGVLLEEEENFDLTRAYLDRCNADTVTQVEIFFDPQGHTARGVPIVEHRAEGDRPNGGQPGWQNAGGRAVGDGELGRSGLFGGYMNANLNVAAAALALSDDNVEKLARNSFTGSFLPKTKKATKCENVEAARAG
jgi:adenosine deaminase